MALPAALAGILRAAAGMGGTATGRMAAGGVQIGPQAGNRFGDMLRRLDTQFQRAEHAGGQFSRRLTGYLDSANTALDQMAAPVRGLVALANPAKVVQFELASRDAHAVLGRQLIPVMEAFTRAARVVGDTMAGLQPVIEPAIKAGAEFVEAVGSEFREAVINCQPEIELLADTMVVLAHAAAAAAKETDRFIDYNFGAFRVATRAAGYGQTKERQFDKRLTGMGAAVQEARFVGAKSIADEAIKNALTLAATGKQAGKPPEQSLQSIDEKMGELVRLEKQKAGEQNRGPQPDPNQAIRQVNTRPY